MSRFPRLIISHPSVVAVLALLATAALVRGAGTDPWPLKFDFGAAEPGFVAVPADAKFEGTTRYGFEPGVAIRIVDRGGVGGRRDFATADTPFHFSVRLPREGNYRVTVTLGDRAAAATTTIKAELRRLMAENVATAPGELKRVTFVVNTRTPVIAAKGTLASGTVRLKAPRESVQEAWAWDDALTLEFLGRPAVAAIEIEPVQVPTLFLLGDSTVCDQSKEPYNSWGQMITRWFTPELAVANHGESGETYRDSLARRRLDKILSVMRPGDWLMMQFGHNDQKQIAAGSGGPFTTYKAEIKRHVDAVRAHGGEPVLVSPMERRGFDANGAVIPSLREYAEATRQAAQELGVPCIDLNEMSQRLYRALGRENSAQAFAAPGGTIDNTHHNNFGSYELAKCVVQAIRDQKLSLARYVVADFPRFDPAHPDDPATFAVPASGQFTNQRPLGDAPAAAAAARDAPRF